MSPKTFQYIIVPLILQDIPWLTLTQVDKLQVRTHAIEAGAATDAMYISKEVY